MNTAWHDIARQLTADDRLTFEIGRVARMHVHLDRMLRDLHQTLASPSLAVYLNGGITSTDRLIDDCRVMLRKAAVDSTITEGGEVALKAASVANKGRNRVVHDMWLQDSAEDPAAVTDDQARWRLLRVTKGELGALSLDPPRDLAYLETVERALTRSRIQIFALASALWATLPFYQGAGATSSIAVEEWVEVMNDRFDSLPDGGFRLHSWRDM